MIDNVFESHDGRSAFWGRGNIDIGYMYIFIVYTMYIVYIFSDSVMTEENSDLSFLHSSAFG